ncbi:DUF2730 family protein [Azospirillum cavernae]|jgi:hypothetical protein|uniref:DUF2730 family protein n=1 Tax=Azospirillum cavernae TaxID=2320860 RepID=A0A418W4A9_9PROT|nr:DUF2730 family protein [Azospirillum cavernae]RJF84861.1 DUF2730 family protein [Azospirillum cavernae]
MPDWLKEWWPFVALAVAVGSPLVHAWVGWSVRARFASKDDLAGEGKARGEALDMERKARHEREDAMREAVNALLGRVDRLESAIEHLPTAEAVATLTLQLTRVEGKLAVFEERANGVVALFERTDRQVQVMDEFLRKVKA